MEITWFGHSCFRLKGRVTTVLADPCPPNAGCMPRGLEASVVTVSHQHEGHCYTQGVSGARLLSGPGEYEIGDSFITGFGSYHDAEKGATRGKNTIYVIEMDSLSLCHLGDLGHLPASDLLADLAGIDVLFLPIAGVGLAGSMVSDLVARMSPRVILPMHYDADKDSSPLDLLLKTLGGKEATQQARLSLTRSTLPPNTQVIVLARAQ
ncbi:MAG: MBL fold metallo-hydrolase [Chloroflexota bacterium]